MPIDIEVIIEKIRIAPSLLTRSFAVIIRSTKVLKAGGIQKSQDIR